MRRLLGVVRLHDGQCGLVGVDDAELVVQVADLGLGPRRRRRRRRQDGPAGHENADRDGVCLVVVQTLFVEVAGAASRYQRACGSRLWTRQRDEFDAQPLRVDFARSVQPVDLLRILRVALSKRSVIVRRAKARRPRRALVVAEVAALGAAQLPRGKSRALVVALECVDLFALVVSRSCGFHERSSRQFCCFECVAKRSHFRHAICLFERACDRAVARRSLRSQNDLGAARNDMW